MALVELSRAEDIVVDEVALLFTHAQTSLISLPPLSQPLVVLAAVLHVS